MLDGNVTRCAKAIREALSEELVTQLARDSGFARRLRKFTPYGAAWTFLVGLASGRVETLADIRRLFIELSGKTIAYKPFHDRLSVPGFPEFFRALLESLMADLVGPVLRSGFKYMQEFEDILCQDGSSFAINDRLAEFFPGRFTSKSPAAVEIHNTYSLFQGQSVAVSIAPDVDGERHFLPEPEELRKKLLLEDAGYIDYEYFEKVKQAGGHLICRAKGSFNPRILGCYRGLPNTDRFVGKKLKEISFPRHHVDLLVEGTNGKGKKFRLRVVGVWVPKEKKHVFLYTTLDPNRFPPLRVGTLYRLRWQVELFFKECKSYTQLKKFQTADPHIVEGLIWASLCAILVRRFLLHSAFEETGGRFAPFIAAAMSWTFFHDLGRSAMDGYLQLKQTLRRILSSLYRLAARTNPNRRDSWLDVGILPIEVRA